MLIAAVVWLVTAVTVALFVIRRWWFPVAINAHARAWDAHFNITLLITGSIFIAAQLALGYVIIRSRGQKVSDRAAHGNNKLELLWTSAAAILFVGLTGISTAIWAGVHLAGPQPNALRIEAVAKQFAWSFRYAGADGRFGRTSLKLVSDANGNPFGIDENDPAGKDDLVGAVVRVPAGAPVELILTSRDVIHNFFVRELRLKQDLVPGMEIPLRFTADTPGAYEVACSELCGLGHHQMKTQLIVMSASDFAQWRKSMAEQAGTVAAPEVR